MIIRAFIVAAVLCSFASVAQAQGLGTLRVRETRSADALTPHRTGEFDAVLPDRSPESEVTRWSERFQFGGDLESWDYDLSTETFHLYVPPDYDHDGAIPPELRPVFDERHLIWIAPNEAGNGRHIFPRAGLALDAALNIARAYHVDRDRVFVSGLSGGGRMAAMLAIDYSDVFAGGFPIIGVTTYQSIPLESDPTQLVPRFPTPAQDILDRARRHPFVIMTGSGDFNREECRLTAQAHARDGFRDLHFLDIEGMGHEMPSVEDFTRGLDLLLGPSN
jgi:hypothetical protein